MTNDFRELTPKQQERAFELGYNGFIGLNNRTYCKDALKYARNVGDTQGIMLSLAMLQNRNAVDAAIKGE